MTQTVKAFDISDAPLTHQLCEVAPNFLTLTTFKHDSEEVVKHYSALDPTSVNPQCGLERYFGPVVAELLEEGFEHLQYKKKKKKRCSSTGGEICVTWTRQLPTDALALWTKEEKNARDE